MPNLLRLFFPGYMRLILKNISIKDSVNKLSSNNGYYCIPKCFYTKNARKYIGRCTKTNITEKIII